MSPPGQTHKVIYPKMIIINELIDWSSESRNSFSWLVDSFHPPTTGWWMKSKQHTSAAYSAPPASDKVQSDIRQVERLRRRTLHSSAPLRQPPFALQQREREHYCCGANITDQVQHPIERVRLHSSGRAHAQEGASRSNQKPSPLLVAISISLPGTQNVCSR